MQNTNYGFFQFFWPTLYIVYLCGCPKPSLSVVRTTQGMLVL